MCFQLWLVPFTIIFHCYLCSLSVFIRCLPAAVSLWALETFSLCLCALFCPDTECAKRDDFTQWDCKVPLSQAAVPSRGCRACRLTPKRQVSKQHISTGARRQTLPVLLAQPGRRGPSAPVSSRVPQWAGCPWCLSFPVPSSWCFFVNAGRWHGGSRKAELAGRVRIVVLLGQFCA